VPSVGKSSAGARTSPSGALTTELRTNTTTTAILARTHMQTLLDHLDHAVLRMLTLPAALHIYVRTLHATQRCGTAGKAHPACAGTDPLGASERCCASSVKPGQQEGWDRKQHSHVSTPWTFQVQALPGMTIRRAVEAWAVGCMDWVHRFNPRRHVATAVQGKRTSLTKESRKCHRSRPSCG